MTFHSVSKRGALPPWRNLRCCNIRLSLGTGSDPLGHLRILKTLWTQLLTTMAVFAERDLLKFFEIYLNPS